MRICQCMSWLREAGASSLLCAWVKFTPRKSKCQTAKHAVKHEAQIMLLYFYCKVMH